MAHRGAQRKPVDHRAPDAMDASWRSALMRSCSASISVTARSPGILVRTSSGSSRTPDTRTRSRRSVTQWQPFATANSIVFEPFTMSGVSRCAPTGHWPCVFPQHGPGMKHQRRIELAAWQASIIAEQPTSLLRGLIHSDGCRVINRVGKGKYAYPRYLFSNRSEDIRRIFREACDSVGVRPTNPKPDEISVARRADVVALDSFVGPKT
jgi:hypothetical protein